MMKGTIQPDIMQVHKYLLQVTGLPPITYVEVTGLDFEIETTDLPDKTWATGGRTKPFEMEVVQPMHHSLEVAAMEMWWQENQDPVSPLAKKLATLIVFSQSRIQMRSIMLVGVGPTKKKWPDLKMEDEGKMADIKWTLKGDDHWVLS